MKIVFERMRVALEHLVILHDFFLNEEHFGTEEKLDFNIYKQNEEKLRDALDNLNFEFQLYSEKERRMILADLIEYIYLGRGYYSMRSREDREKFIKAILHFVNMLMCYEMVTVSSNVRKKLIEILGDKIGEIKEDNYFAELRDFSGKVGLPPGITDAPKHLNKYFDSILPKTAGGLWHELLVYIFLLRNDFGYIVPLLLNQKLMSLTGRISPPDFLLITYDKQIFGIEVGRKKEIQSGSFSLQTAIPTASIDTENSRVSDRCPICKRWIPFCDYVINNYSDFNNEITKAEIKCLDECNHYSNKDQIVEGICPYTKYSRDKAPTLDYAKHEFANGLHYHYQCVLNKLDEETRKKVVEAKDSVALKTHYPYYSGLEELMKKGE